MRIFNKMKKMLLVAAALFTVNGAFAESKTVNYIQNDKDNVPGAETVNVSLDAISFSYLGDAGGWNVKSNKQSYSGNSYTHYVSGKSDPTVTDGVPTAGSVMGFVPQYDGQIALCMVLNKGKSTFVLEDGVGLSTDIKVDGKWNDGSVADTAFTSGGKMLRDKVYGTLTFDVKANKQYYVYCTGSKMGYYGFSYTYDDAPASSGPDFTACNEAIAWANAEKAKLNAEDEAEAMVITEIDNAVMSLQEMMTDPEAISEYTQEDWDLMASMLKEQIQGYIDMIPALKLQPVAEQLIEEGYALYDSYAEDIRTDEAGLAAALQALRRAVTQENIDAVNAAMAAFKTENDANVAAGGGGSEEPETPATVDLIAPDQGVNELEVGKTYVLTAAATQYQVSFTAEKDGFLTITPSRSIRSTGFKINNASSTFTKNANGGFDKKGIAAGSVFTGKFYYTGETAEGEVISFTVTFEEGVPYSPLALTESAPKDGEVWSGAAIYYTTYASYMGQPYFNFSSAINTTDVAASVKIGEEVTAVTTNSAKNGVVLKGLPEVMNAAIAAGKIKAGDTFTVTLSNIKDKEFSANALADLVYTYTLASTACTGAASDASTSKLPTYVTFSFDGNVNIDAAKFYYVNMFTEETIELTGEVVEGTSVKVAGPAIEGLPSRQYKIVAENVTDADGKAISYSSDENTYPVEEGKLIFTKALNNSPFNNPVATVSLDNWSEGYTQVYSLKSFSITWPAPVVLDETVTAPVVFTKESEQEDSGDIGWWSEGGESEGGEGEATETEITVSHAISETDPCTVIFTLSQEVTELGKYSIEMPSELYWAKDYYTPGDDAKNNSFGYFTPSKYAWVEIIPVPVADGTYYMKNVAAGKMLVGGDTWGTHATFGEYGGLDFGFALGADGKYSIDSKLSNGGNSHYFGADGWMDAAITGWNVVKLPNGNYTLTANGTTYLGYDGNAIASTSIADASSETAQWMLLTRDEAIAALAEANPENPLDATFLISCANFGRNDTRFSTAWQGGPAQGGSSNNMCAERWNANFDIYQELTGMPNGYYTLNAQGFYRAGGGGTTGTEQNAFLYANDVTTALVNILSEAGNAAITGSVSTPEGYGVVPNDMNSASGAFTAGLYENTLNVKVTDGTLRIGVKKEVLIANDWTIFDNFRLTYLGAKSSTELLVDSLNTLIAEANELKAGLDAADATHAQVIGMIDQMIPAAQAVADAPESDAAVQEMISSVYMFLYQTKIQLAQYDAQMAQAFMATYENPTDEAGFKAAITQVFVISNGLMMGEGSYTLDQLTEAVAAMKAAQEAFIVENTPEPAPELGDRVYDFSRAAWGGHTEDLTVTEGTETVETIDGIGVVTVTIGDQLVEGFLTQGNIGFLKRGSADGLLTMKGPRTIAIQQVKAGQVVTWYGKEQQSAFTLTLVENGVATADETNTTAGSVYTYNVVADGTMAVRMERYAYIDSITVVTPVAPSFDLTAYNDTVAWANEIKATLNAEDPTEAEMIVAIDDALASAATRLEELLAAPETTQAEIDFVSVDLKAAVTSYISRLDIMKMWPEVDAARAEGDSIVMLYPEVLRTDEAGLIVALQNLPRVAMWVTSVEELQTSIKAVNDAVVPFLQENNANLADSANVAVAGAEEAVAQYPNADATGLTAAAEAVKTILAANETTNTKYPVADLLAALDALAAAQAAFVEDATTVKCDLTKEMFLNWDGVGADAQPTTEATYPDYNLGTEISAGGMLYGYSTVYYLSYADLTGYTKMIIEGTPGMQFRVLMNRVENEGALTEVNVTIGEDGKAVVDFAGMEYVHLNAIKAGWGSAAGTVTKVTLVKPYVEEVPEGPTVAYLCGATETTEDIYTALVAAGYNVTPLNYDEVSLTEEIVANDFVGKYDVVVLAGATGSSTNLAKTANLLVGKVNVLSTKSFWYKHYGTNGENPGTAAAPSLSLTKSAAFVEHPIYAGIEGDEFAVFNDMAKENGRYLQSNGSFAEGPEQVTLGTTLGADCIGEAWSNGFGYVIVPVDGAQPEGYLTEDGKALFVNIVEYLINGEQYVSGIADVTINGAQWPADIYDVNGRMVKKAATSLEGLQKGLYFVNGKKLLVK